MGYHLFTGVGWGGGGGGWRESHSLSSTSWLPLLIVGVTSEFHKSARIRGVKMSFGTGLGVVSQRSPH